MIKSVSKKKHIIALFILIAVVFILASDNGKPLNNINIINIESIFLYNNNIIPREGYYINEKEDVVRILKLLKSMRLYKHKNIELESVNYTIYINPIIGDNISIGILPDNMIVIGSKLYSTGRDYNNSFKVLLYDLSKKYNNIIK